MKRYITILLILSTLLFNSMVQAQTGVQPQGGVTTGGGSSGVIAGDSTAAWRVEYFDNLDFQPPSVVRSFESALHFNWGYNSPAPGIAPDLFSSRWQASVFFTTGVYQFTTTVDDEVRVYIDNRELIIDTFGEGIPGQTVTAQVTMLEGLHNIQVDYRELGGLAYLNLDWAYVGPAENSSPIAATWIAQYYNNETLSGNPSAIFSETAPSHNWGNGSPFSTIGRDDFSVRWTTTVNLEGTYLIEAEADDGVRVYVNNQLQIDEWHGAQAETYYSVVTLPAGLHNLTVEYYEFTGNAYIDFRISKVLPETTFWAVEYYNNRDLAGSPVASSIVRDPNNNWGNESPSASIPANNFSVRWTSRQDLASGTYRLTLSGDDGLRAYVNGVRIIDEWHASSGQVYQVDFPLPQGQHSIVIEFFEAGGLAYINYDLTRIGDYQQLPITVPSETTTLTIATPRLNVRSTPSTSGEVVGRVFEGEQYTVVGRNTDSTWWQIQFGTQTGWVYNNFVNVVDPRIVPITSESGAPNVVPTIYTLRTNAALTLRSRPSTRGAFLGQMPANAIAQIVARDSRSAWWYVKYGDIVGWVSGSFVSLPANLDLTQIPVQN
ncbi:MAG: SH3 domain-containing protein [Anaerolineae bacterium]|nr:SH3 domain-containing protein [Anaerolineae bacterium]